MKPKAGTKCLDTYFSLRLVSFLTCGSWSSFYSLVLKSVPFTSYKMQEVVITCLTKYLSSTKYQSMCLVLYLSTGPLLTSTPSFRVLL